MLRQGVHLAVCQMATRDLSGIIAKATGTDAEAIYKELVAQSAEQRAHGAGRDRGSQSCAGARLLLRIRR